jgi:CheY-like chemotaxis protein
MTLGVEDVVFENQAQDAGPQADGAVAETRQRLKAEARFANVPIVALTASAMRGDEEKARAAGCAGYITKPIDTRAFSRQIGEFLREVGSTE